MGSEGREGVWMERYGRKEVLREVPGLEGIVPATIEGCGMHGVHGLHADQVISASSLGRKL